MMIKKLNFWIWALRILVSGLFVFSAMGKLFPAHVAIYVFEKQLVSLGIANWCLAPFLARGIVAFELFLGLALLQNHFLKKFIIPTTVLMLFAFCVHLTIVIIRTGNTGNCGCFGQLISMTPLEAIIKNVICIGMLVFIYLKTKSKERNLHRYPTAILISTYLFVFIFFYPDCCCATVNPTPASIAVTDSLNTTNDSLTNVVPAQDENITATANANGNKKDTVKVKQAEPKSLRPKVATVFAKYQNFHGKKVDLDAGRKIICLFSLDCEHCMAACKALNEMRKANPGFPPVYILAFGAEDGVDNFFKEGGGRFPYAIIAPAEFFQLLQAADAPPRIVVSDNGNQIEEFINFEVLDKQKLLDATKR